MRICFSAYGESLSFLISEVFRLLHGKDLWEIIAHFLFRVNYTSSYQIPPSTLLHYKGVPFLPKR